MNKTLTISIPTWNRAALLNKLLLEVTEKIVECGLENDIQLLVSNNNSSDTTDSILNGLIQKYNFISYNKNETNIGGKSNVLKSMELAKTPFVMFFGDDDNVNIYSLKKIILLLKR